MSSRERHRHRHYLHLDYMHAHRGGTAYTRARKGAASVAAKRPLCRISGDVEHVKRAAGRAHTLPHKYAYLRACVCACVCVDATDNMQLRAVSSALSCSALRARIALSLPWNARGMRGENDEGTCRVCR